MRDAHTNLGCESTMFLSEFYVLFCKCVLCAMCVLCVIQFFVFFYFLTYLFIYLFLLVYPDISKLSFLFLGIIFSMPSFCSQNIFRRRFFFLLQFFLSFLSPLPYFAVCCVVTLRSFVRYPFASCLHHFSCLFVYCLAACSVCRTINVFYARTLAKILLRVYYSISCAVSKHTHTPEHTRTPKKYDRKIACGLS